MNQNEEIYKKLINKDDHLMDFYKEKIKDILKKYNIEYTEDIASKLLDKSISTYENNMKIAFLFHLQATIKKEMTASKTDDNGPFLKNEFKILTYYFKETDGTFLSTLVHKIFDKSTLSNGTK